MVRRIVAIGSAVTLVSFAALADEMSGEDVEVPPPATIVEEEAVVIEEPVTAAPPPYVALESTSLAAGVGLSWGEGVLSFEGQRHSFSVKGMSLGDVGFAKLISEGSVSNLEDLADFAGTYVAVEAGGAAGVGGSVLSMRNAKGVVITLKSDVEGLALSLGPEGLRISLD